MNLGLIPGVILGIETSCDDTSCAILDDNNFVRAMCSANQDVLHQPFGGIVPEIASRNHTLVLTALMDATLSRAQLTLENVKGIAVTNRPGLLGSLLVGVVTAKTLSMTLQIPYIGVHHIEGHIMAPFVSDDSYRGPEWGSEPFLSLVVSGGHTSLYLVRRNVLSSPEYQLLGSTIDDAAGEAFDKFAKMLGLSYPGGVWVDRYAQNGNPKKYSFPRAMLKENHLNFSFSGLKTAAQVLLNKMSPEEIQQELAHLCASFQAAIVDVLLDRMKKAVKEQGVSRISVTGGVSANSALRSEMEAYALSHQLEIAIPPLRYCTDNAAMIARAGALRFQNQQTSSLDLGVFARAELV